MIETLGNPGRGGNGGGNGGSGAARREAAAESRNPPGTTRLASHQPYPKAGGAELSRALQPASVVRKSGHEPYPKAGLELSRALQPVSDVRKSGLEPYPKAGLEPSRARQVMPTARLSDHEPYPKAGLELSRAPPLVSTACMSIHEPYPKAGLEPSRARQVVPAAHLSGHEPYPKAGGVELSRAPRFVYAGADLPPGSELYAVRGRSRGRAVVQLKMTATAAVAAEYELPWASTDGNPRLAGLIDSTLACAAGAAGGRASLSLAIADKEPLRVPPITNLWLRTG